MKLGGKEPFVESNGTLIARFGRVFGEQHTVDRIGLSPRGLFRLRIDSTQDENSLQCFQWIL